MAFDASKPADNETFGNAPGVIRANFSALAAHHAGASSPASPQEGMIWFDTTAALLKIYHGGAWVALGSVVSDVLEVLSARGTTSLLANRLNVALNADGTLKGSVGAGTEWYAPGVAATYSAANTVTLPGDVTAIFTQGRRCKATLTGGTVYLTVKSSAYTTLTTVTFYESTLDNTLSALEISFISNGATGSNPRSAFRPPVTDITGLPVTENEHGDIRQVKSDHTVRAWNDTDKAWVDAGAPQFFAYPQSTPNMTVRVRPGIAVIDGVFVELTSATNSPTVTAPSSNPRIDILTLDNAGTLAWTVGAEAASPAAPKCPLNKMPICEIYVRVGSSAINAYDLGSAAYIKRDVRASRRVEIKKNTNYAHNPAGSVAQHAAFAISGAATGVYNFGACDRFMGAWTGTTCSAGSLTQDTAATFGRTGNAHHFSGVTLTGTGVLYHRQRMESKDAKAFKNQSASFAVKVLHDVGSNVNFTLYVRKANAANNFSATTAIANSGAIAVASGSATTLVFENVSMGDCSNGIEFEVKAEVGAITTKNLRLTDYQIEHGAASTDIDPRPYQEELMFCRWYYRTSFPPGTPPSQNSGVFSVAWIQILTGYGYRMTIPFDPPMRSTPVITGYNPSAANGLARGPTADLTTMTVAALASGFYFAAYGGVDDVTGNPIYWNWSASAEL